LNSLKKIIRCAGEVKDGGKKAIMLLGHGSKAPEANETLRKAAKAVEERGGYGMVLPAFLQMEKPDFQEGVDALVAKGFNDITVMPYFLYMGLHVTQDLPAEMEEARARRGLRNSAYENLGFHDKLIDITIQRIEVHRAKAASAPCQHPIEKRELQDNRDGSSMRAYSPAPAACRQRVIHTTADFEFRTSLKFTPARSRPECGP
jgi:sirohydrochlorin ferrochelatase